MILKIKLISLIYSRLISLISSKQNFNRQYANKRWDGLWELPELGRYSIIAGYVAYHCREPRILDLGCGEGVLQQKLNALNYAYYLGIDFSKVAIDKAKETETSNTQFRIGDLDHLDITGEYDVIIYNESLYYLNDPIKAIRAVAGHARPGCIFIISMHKVGGDRDPIWAAVDHELDLKDRTDVVNRDATSWTISVYTLKEGKT